MTNAEPPDESVVEVRATASAALIPTIRAVAGDLAARADFDLDAIDDLRMAVDEACAAVVGLAAPQAQLRCVFTIRPDRIQVIVETDVLAGQPTLATDSFGWRVLETLADGVSAHHVAGTDGQPDRIAVRLDKDAVPGVR